MTRLLQGLVAKGALVREGQGRWTRYRLPETGHSEHRESGSIHKPEASEHKGRGSEYSAEMMALAEPARNQKRLQPEEMERIILGLCRGRWLTRNDLTELLAKGYAN